MWELDHKEDWTLKNWCFWIVVLGKILESPLDCKEIKPVNPKGNQPWIFIGRTDAEVDNTLATWYEEPTHWKRPWCWERWNAKEERVVRIIWLGSITNSMNGNLSKLPEIVEGRGAWCAAIHDVKSWTWLRKRTMTTKGPLNTITFWY